MKTALLTVATALLAGSAMANNITVSGVGLTGQDATANTQQITFNVGWENSWRTSTNESNWDGAWVFVKYRKVNTSIWQHCTLNYNTGGATAAGHVEPSGSTIRTQPDGKGVFVYRNANGQGTVNFTSGQLRWNYGTDGLNDNDSVEIRVFAVEMVYVPEGPFYLGTGGTESGRFKVGNSNAPYLVTSEASIPIGILANNLYYTPSGGAYGDGMGPIPATYPKGFDTIWVMKYECSQQQYADYMNTLDAASANLRNIGTLTGSANAWVAPVPTRAIGGAGDDDILAYLDWAALRPMTETEYEKACRGANNVPIADEYAWGNTTIINLSSGIQNPATDSERVSNFNANFNPINPLVSRPLRNGAFATSSTTSRTATGGTYYGIMEMSGNVTEQCVTAGNPSGRAFTGLHGDGMLSGQALANVTNWSANMMGLRGGGYATTTSGIAVSYRVNAAVGGVGRSPDYGIRGVRTAQ